MRRPIIILMLLALASCSPRVITNTVVRRDTLYVANHVRDSVFFRDSIWIKEYVKGDTVKITEYREKWRERLKEVHDTSYVYISMTDSVRVVVPVEVEKKLSVGKKIRLDMFLPLLLLALVGWRREIMTIVLNFTKVR